jgi:hypothetical protein
METLIVKIDTPGHAKNLAAFLKDLIYVKEVKQEKDNKKLSDADWIKPSSRQASDEEIELMIAECEIGPFVSSAELRKNVAKRVKK